MSCSLCRLPFTPSHTSVSPRWPPTGTLSDKQLQYMKHAVGMGQYLIGLVVNLVHLDNNLFTVNNSPVLVSIAWEVGNKTFIALHTHCAMLLRHHLGFTSNAAETLIECSLLDDIIGPTQSGTHAGRLSDIDYEAVLGQGSSRVDIESLWSKGDSAGNANFDWQEWKQRGLDWTAVRPDVFPRFRPTILPARLSSFTNRPVTSTTTDIITTQSLDVLHILLPYLSDESYVNLVATCRTLRYHALTTFQPHARARVLRLGWTVPLENEYASYVRRKHPDLELPRTATARPAPSEAQPQPQNTSTDPSMPTDETTPRDDSAAASAGSAAPGSCDTNDTNRDHGRSSREALLAQCEMAHAVHSPVDADWLHYLSQVHRTPAMRARRWVWALAAEVACVYRQKRAVSQYADVEDDPEGDGMEGEKGEKSAGKGRKSKAWMSYARAVAQQLLMRQVVQGEGMRTGKGPPFSW